MMVVVIVVMGVVMMVVMMVVVIVMVVVMGAFRLFTFRVIIERYELIVIMLPVKMLFL